MREFNRQKEPSKLKNEESSTSPESASTISIPHCCKNGCVSSSRKECAHKCRIPQRRPILSEEVAHDRLNHGKRPASSEGSVHENRNSRRRFTVSEEYPRESWKRQNWPADTSNPLLHPVNPDQTTSSKVGASTSKTNGSPDSSYLCLITPGPITRSEVDASTKRANVNPDSLNPEIGHDDGHNSGGQLASGDTTESDEEAQQIPKAQDIWKGKGDEETEKHKEDPEAIRAARILLLMNFEDTHGVKPRCPWLD